MFASYTDTCRFLLFIVVRIVFWNYFLTPLNSP